MARYLPSIFLFVASAVSSLYVAGQDQKDLALLLLACSTVFCVAIVPPSEK